MYKFCYIHNSQWHYNVVSFWWWNIPYTSQLCRVGLFLKGTSVKLQCLVFCLLTSACSSKPNSGIIFFQEIFPNPPSHLPPFLPDYFPCPFAVLSVPGTSLCFSTGSFLPNSFFLLLIFGFSLFFLSLTFYHKQQGEIRLHLQHFADLLS